MMRLLLFILPIFAYGGTVVVDASGNGDFTEIQPAIHFASSGDTIFVRNGEYRERWIVDNRELFIIGESSEFTIIDSVAEVNSTENIYISKLQFRGRNPNNANNGLIINNFLYVYDDTSSVPTVHIENCVFNGNAQNYAGISIGVFEQKLFTSDSFRTRISNALFIKNCVFNNLLRGVVIESVWIVGKIGLETNLQHKLTINAALNYFFTDDSTVIAESIVDFRNAPDALIDTSTSENYLFFNYCPFATDTNQFEPRLNTVPGINNNSFSGCEHTLFGFLPADRYTSIRSMEGKQEKNTNIIVYPNPFNSSFVLDLSNQKRDFYSVKIVNILGQVVYSNEIAPSANPRHRITPSLLSSGEYLLVATSREAKLVRRITLIK
jgi:hypothetical protein